MILKIYWNKFPIAKILVGKDYLTPNLEIIVDEMLEQKQIQKLIDFLKKWLNEKINLELKSLIDLKILIKKTLQ